MISFKNIINKEEKISVIGLGYVGFPLALNFAKKAMVIGFDIDDNKIKKYKNKINLKNIFFTSKENKLNEAKFHIIAVPTPVYQNKLPNLEYIKEASKILGRNLNKGSIVVYESTVYPGVTENVCIPILEKESKLKCGTDFKVGYSPERISPGDPIHKLENIVKIVSGIDKETTDTIAKVYKLIIKTDIYKAESMKIAEAAKIIENIQRDVNIALINELSKLLDKLQIDTASVLNATATKWNSLNFKPGLVGGHCIGIDPYFLIYRAKQLGLNLEITETSRKVNETMGEYIAEKTIEKLLDLNSNSKNLNIAIFGFSFKENTKDIRNTKVIDIIDKLKEHNINITVIDPIVDPKIVKDIYGIKIYNNKEICNMDGIIFAVAHEVFKKYSLKDIKYMCRNRKPVLIDVKNIFNKAEAEKLNFNYWSL